MLHSVSQAYSVSFWPGLNWSICIQSFPQFFTVPSFKMVFFFFFRFFPFFHLPVELELLFPPPPVLIKKRSIFHRGFFHMPRLNYQWSVVKRSLIDRFDTCYRACCTARLHVHDTVRGSAQHIPKYCQRLTCTFITMVVNIHILCWVDVLRVNKSEFLSRL